MAIIQLRLITSNSIVSQAIRAVTYSDYSHVDFVLPGEGYLGAHSDGGVLIRPFGYCKPAKVMNAVVKVSEPVADSVIRFARAQIGKPYDHGAIFGLLARRNWQDSEKWFCSELVAAAFLHAGHPILNTMHLERVTPRDVSISPLLHVLSYS